MKTIYKIRINEDESVSLQQTTIDTDKSWREAVVATTTPAVTSAQRAVPSYDFSKTPVEISYSVVDLTVSERQTVMIADIKKDYRLEVNSILNTDVNNMTLAFDPTVIVALKNKAIADISAINDATTHDQLDLLI